MRIIFFFFSVILFTTSSIAQEHEEVVSYIENMKYSDKPRAECYVDINKFEVEGDFLKDIETGLTYGVKNTGRTENPTLTNLDRSKEKVSLSSLTRKGPHYLFSCTVTDFEFIDNKEGQGGTYSFGAALKGLDVVTGTIIFYEIINVQGKSKNMDSRILQYGSSDMSKAIAKKIRETTSKAVRAYFPKANWVQSIDEIKKDKAKLVSADKLNHMVQQNPKKVYAYVVNKEIEINNTKHFTFTKIGEMKKPKSDKIQRNKIFYQVNKGEKEILAQFNEGKKIYLTTIVLGDND
ncbi:MAG: hypothetical protein P1U56_16165 [Saprospiraceae bacterium]|nr:hypothetical protein [Saprospiraceae bacterium]